MAVGESGPDPLDSESAPGEISLAVARGHIARYDKEVSTSPGVLGARMAGVAIVAAVLMAGLGSKEESQPGPVDTGDTAGELDSVQG